MANHSPPSPPPQSSTLLLLVLLIIISLSASASASPTASVSFATTFQEHETMLESLRNHGYTLFTNAIATSDLQYQLLPTSSLSAAPASGGGADPTSPFTLFAPVDDLLFALDMASDAAAYVDTLRYHIVPNRRYTFGDLQNLTSPFLDTLLPNYSVLIGITQERDVNATVSGVMVDGVRVSNPDLYLGSRVAVHGIDGILLTGLNMNQDLVYGSDNGSSSGIFSPAESPVPLSGFHSNSPSEGIFLPPMSQFGWNHAPEAAPPSDGNIPAAAPSFIENIPLAAPSFVENIPAAPPSIKGHIPAATSPSEISKDEPEKIKSLATKKHKKQGKRQRKSQGHRRKHGGLRRYHLDDL